MVKLKKLAVVLICAVIVFTSLCFAAGAADIENEKTYKPLDLVVVIDSSGSMNDSDPGKTALAAVRMLVNMMPAADSKVGIVSFNKTATVLTKDAAGNDALLGLANLNDVGTIRKNVSGVVYNGGTGIGNAVFAATELLNANKDPERTQAIILFTDGVNDFGNDSLALSKCEKNEANALLWAKKNNCPIYCVGYDYITSAGISSMGVNGEGINKLNNIATTTNGKCKAIKNINEIEQLLIEFLADVCDLNYTTVATIPGDGDAHECPINVSPSVIEANIRIAGSDENAIKNGTIKLFDPDGNEIELKNSGNVRFDVDATSASIKVTMPKTGQWILFVKDIKGDDIHVGLLEHFKMNLTSKITLPAGNPDGVAYSNDTVGIRTWLTYDGVDLNDEAIYNAVKSAKATFVSRANPENKKVIELKRNGFCFEGEFKIPQDCYYDIIIRLDWDTVYREDTLEIRSMNKPPQLVGDIPEVKVNKGKTITVSDIYQYVADEENDKITASVTALSSPDAATVVINGDSLSITGNKWSSTLVTIEFSDEMGNSVESTFLVNVNDPVAIALIILTLILLFIAVMLLLLLAKKASNKVSGKMRVVSIAEGFVNASGDYKNTKLIYSNPNVEHDTSVVNSDGSVSAGTSNPLAGASNPFGGASGGTADPFGNTSDPFGGVVNNSIPDDADCQTDSSAPNPFFDFTSSQTVTSVSKEEEARSANFNEKFAIGNSRTKKTDMATVMDLFISVYSDYMNVGNGNSKKAAIVKDFVEQNLKPSFIKVALLGTLYGKSGVILKIDKNKLAKGEIYCHSPRLSKCQASMNPNNRLIKLSISIPYGEKKSDGSIPCSHIEIEYSK